MRWDSHTIDTIGDALASLLRGEDVFESRLTLENHLVDALRSSDLAAVLEAMQAVPGFDFMAVETDQPNSALLQVCSPDRSVTIELSQDELATFASVDLDPSPSATGQKENPDHAWFYGTWTRLIELGFDDHFETLGDAEQAVGLVALLEAEVMNGGIGQYLANSNGQYIEPTRNVLNDIGATGALDLLSTAVSMRSDSWSFDDLWNERGDELSALDDQYLSAAEDLATLVASKYRE